MRHQADTFSEKELATVMDAAKAMRSKELARIGGKVLRIPQATLRRLTTRSSVKQVKNPAPGHSM